MMAAKSLNLGVGDIKVQLGEGVQLGNLKIGTDPATADVHVLLQGPRRQARIPRSIRSSMSTRGKIPVDKYRDKIVLIGPTAAGVGSASVTPVSPAMPPVLTLAHSVSSILQEHFFVAPTWGILGRIAAYSCWSRPT